MRYSDVISPEWGNESHTIVNCQVKFANFSDYIPFTASPEDSALHGKKIFTECANGTWGDISAYIAPVRTAADYRRANAARFRLYRTAATDTLTMLMCITEPDEQQAASIVSVREYLAALAVMDIAVEVPAWPVLPECVVL